MKVAFYSELRVTLASAKTVTIKAYPELSDEVKAIKNKVDLEKFLNDRGYIVYIDVDPTEDQNVFLAKEAEIQAEVDARLADGYCEPPLPTIQFTEDDIPEHFCAVPEDTPIPEINITEFELELKKLIRAQDGGLSEGVPLAEVDAGSPIGKSMQCMAEIQKITDELTMLSNREQQIKETVVNFEQLLYHYRSMELYYQTKLDTLEALTDQFTVLLREKKHIEEIDIPEIQARTAAETANRNTYINNLPAGTTRPTATEIAFDAKIQQLQGGVSAYQTRITEIHELVNANRANTYAFDMTDLQDADISNRRAALKDALQSVSNTLTLGNFSTNVELDTIGGSIEDGFKLTIRHETKDQAGILIGLPLLFSQTHGNVAIKNYTGSDAGGVMYTKLYNIWGNIELFFTREERGLTTDGSQMDPTLLKTGAQPVNGNYIQSLSKFEDFYVNFPTYHQAKTDSVKETVVEPALLAGQLAMKDSATKEVQILLSFGKAFEVLPEDEDLDGNGARLNGLINTIKNSSSEYLQKLDACKTTYLYAKSKHEEILRQMEDKKGEYSQVSCVKNTPDPGTTKKEPGGDPLGKTTMGKEDPNDPNFTKFCYWRKFATYATAVGLLPLPGSGGFKYWPVGLTIPNPSGITKIPLPIVWIPLTVIALPVGIFVMFIGQCGIVPSPFLLYIGATGEKKFLVSLRPTQQFGADAGEGTIKLLSQGGIAINTKITDLVAGLPVVPGFPSINIPGFTNLSPDSSSTIIADTKEKILIKVNKLKNPDISKLTDLRVGATFEEKKQAFKDVVETWLQDLKIPSKKFPKNAKGVNPKPTPMTEMTEQLKVLGDMNLPNIAPSLEPIDITAAVMDKIDSIKIADINLPPRLVQGITVPTMEDPAKVEAFVADVKEVMSKIMAASIDNITPKSLGIAATFGDVPVFLNPYQCRQSGGGLALPNIGPLTGALVGIKAAAEGLIISLDGKLITDNFKGGQNIAPPPVTPEAIRSLLKNIASVIIPPVTIPNPSNISIKDMILSGVKAVTGMSLPALPAPGPIQPRVELPGSVLKNALIPAVTNTIDAALDPLTLPPLDTISSVDVKQIAINFIEQSFAPVEAVMKPILTAINIVSGAKSQNMGFGEMLGLKKVPLDTQKVAITPEVSLLIATKVLATIPAPPYPAVAIAPTVFKLIHPILSQDDLPPWDRLSLSNPLFVVFLDQFCVQGKNGGGLFRDP